MSCEISTYQYKKGLERRSRLWAANAFTFGAFGEILLSSGRLPWLLEQMSQEQRTIFFTGVMVASLVSTFGWASTELGLRRINKALGYWKECFEDARDGLAVYEKNGKLEDRFVCYLHDRYDLERYDIEFLRNF